MRHRVAALSVVCLLALAPIHAADDPATAVIQRLDARSDAYAKVALQIWNWAELGFQETKSSALLQQQLSAAGFRMQAGVADMPTAFIAEWGSGQPVIGTGDAHPLRHLQGRPGAKRRVRLRRGRVRRRRVPTRVRHVKPEWQAPR